VAAIVKPNRQTVFSDIRGPLPTDLLDSQFNNLVDAIHSTQMALRDIRRDDGQLKGALPAPDQLIERIVDRVMARLKHTTLRAEQLKAAVERAGRDIHLRARDAEEASAAAGQYLSAVSHAQAVALDAESDAENAADRAENAAITAGNSANWADTQAKNAMAEQQQAAAWSEYLAGPVVNPADAPAYAAGTPYGRGLYYQPVEGGLAGLWSAKWWALYAQQLVGNWNFFYLGAWPVAPFPGSTNPETGVAAPNPIAEGSFYYNTATNQLYIWDGHQWNTPMTLTPAYSASFIYVATAGQTVFSGADSNAQIPLVNGAPSDVHLNGVRLVRDLDYTVNDAANSLTLVVGATVNSIVQWDLLVEASKLAPGAVNLFKLQITPLPDGTNKTFTMQYTNPSTGLQPAAASGVAQISISVDGVVQEPVIDFDVNASTLNMATAPPAGCRFWGVWHASEIVVP
jgi:hypothetical protein